MASPQLELAVSTLESSWSDLTQAQSGQQRVSLDLHRALQRQATVQAQAQLGTGTAIG